MINILACDPGAANFGYAVIQGRMVGKKISDRILVNGMCPCPIKQVKGSQELRAKQIAFEKWYTGLLKKYKIDAVCAERFMARGLLGALGEYIGIMIGIMLTSAPHIQFKVFPAATWKNAVRRNVGDKEFLNRTYKIAKVTPHQLDACLIGVWTLFQGFKQKDFGPFQLAKSINKFLDQVEAVSTEKLTNRKNKR